MTVHDTIYKLVNLLQPTLGVPNTKARLSKGFISSLEGDPWELCWTKGTIAWTCHAIVTRYFTNRQNHMIVLTFVATLVKTSKGK